MSLGDSGLGGEVSVKQKSMCIQYFIPNLSNAEKEKHSGRESWWLMEVLKGNRHLPAQRKMLSGRQAGSKCQGPVVRRKVVGTAGKAA